MYCRIFFARLFMIYERTHTQDTTPYYVYRLLRAAAATEREGAGSQTVVMDPLLPICPHDSMYVIKLPIRSGFFLNSLCKFKPSSATP